MDDRFRLIFRGEVLEGQHPAVVRRRITEALKLDDEKSAALFSGKVVVLKRDADEKTAIRYQALFQKAGARLRLLSVEDTDRPSPESRPSSFPVDAPVTAASSTAAGTQTVESAASRAPASGEGGSGEGASRGDASGYGLSVAAEYVAPPARPAIEINAPDFVVAERGVLLRDPQQTVTPNIPQPEFDLAEPGADIGPKRQVEPVLDITTIQFEVAEIGADLGELRKSVAAVEPDISHLKLVDA